MLKLLKNESLHSTIRAGYIVVLILYALARQNVTALQPYLMNDILNLFVIGVAGLLVLWDVVIFRNIWKTKYIWLLAGFGVLTVISSALGFKYGYMENVKTIANLFIQFCLLYVVSVKKDRKSLEKEFRVIATAVSAVWLVAVAVSVYMYFADITYTANRYLWGDVTEIPQGFVREHMGAVVMRLWGVFVDPNFASAVSIALIAMSLFSVVSSKNKGFRAFHTVNILFQYLYVVLSNSRMGLLALCLSTLAGGWYYSFFILGGKKLNIIIKEIFAVIMAVICVAACYGSVLLTKTVLPYVRLGIEYTAEFIGSEDESTTQAEETTLPEETTVPGEEVSTQEATTEETTTEEPTTQKEVEKLDRQDVVVKEDISNGRFGLWMEGLKTVFKENPVLGVGPRNYHSAAKEIDDSTRISTGYSIHNSYIELLMGNGIIGALVLVLFLVLCAKDIIVLRYKNPRKAKTIGFLAAGMINLLACGMFIACLFYTLSGATIILFTFLGYAVRLAVLDDADEKQ